MLKDESGTQLKDDVGVRFKAFRVAQKKAQHVLAGELEVHQSTITNIEHGTTFPKISYLHYFWQKYGLNINWLLTGEGDMYVKGRVDIQIPQEVTLPPVKYGVTRHRQFLELSRLLRVPPVEQVILAKMTECRILFKEEIQDYFDEFPDQEPEKIEFDPIPE